MSGAGAHPELHHAISDLMSAGRMVAFSSVEPDGDYQERMLRYVKVGDSYWYRLFGDGRPVTPWRLVTADAFHPFDLLNAI